MDCCCLNLTFCFPLQQQQHNLTDSETTAERPSSPLRVAFHHRDQTLFCLDGVYRLKEAAGLSCWLLRAYTGFRLLLLRQGKKAFCSHPQ